MIFDELTLHNFGVFSGTHTLTLTPPASDRPVVLIGGLNGCGKTTLLDAIQLALFGSRARLAGRGRDGYERYLAGQIHRSCPAGEGAAVELEFRITREDRVIRIRVCRSWHVTGSGTAEKVRVLCDDNLAGVLAPDDALTADWADRVEAWVPARLAPLFFFDGEQIQALSDPAMAQQVLRTAIHGLLGVDLTDQLVADLKVVEARTRKRDQEVPPHVTTLKATRDADAVTAHAEHARASGAVKAAQARLTKAREDADKADEAYRIAGGDLWEQRRALEHALATAKDRIRQAEDDMREVITGGCAPLLLASELLAEVVERAEAETDGDRQRVLADALPERDRAVLAELAGNGLTRATLEQVRAVLDADTQARRESARSEAIVALSPYATAQARRLLDTELPVANKTVTGLVAAHTGLMEEASTLERRLASVPNPESIQQVADDRKQAHAAVEAATRELAQAEEDERRTARETERAERLRADAYKEYAEAWAGVEDARRILAYSKKSRETLAKYRTRLIQHHIGRIQGEVLACLRALLRKTDLVSDVTIDVETFAVTLQTRTGAGTRSLPAHKLSAGERELLAVSLLWGLARASRHQLPVVIDTPLARLDGPHRTHLIERYFPAAARQVLLLSTDKEITDAEVPLLAEHIGHTYQLEFDMATASTTIRTGYAWHAEEATHAR
ncbi:DNA sulfur modification protein DndD [Nonomuraea maheshkhaliensis]|uniref:Nuclease SbcCD subunit C n=1 Tax=Nonomuraea maheshkhaliensis TaxID=419590 RepID=A0ABN2ERW4_9ACTN